MSYEEEYEKDKKQRFKLVAIIAITILFLGIGGSFLFGKKKSSISDDKAVVRETPCKPKIVHDTIYKCPPKTTRVIPAITKYKVGDWVCAWDKITGVVQDISWSESDPNLLQYEIVYSTGTDVNGIPQWGNDIFFETTLTAGKCH